MEQKIKHFSQASSRFPLQSCGLNPSPQGFSLQSGLKDNILLFRRFKKETIKNRV
jgi:hypothetical protein